jgi:hypothetical protein
LNNQNHYRLTTAVFHDIVQTNNLKAGAYACDP